MEAALIPRIARLNDTIAPAIATARTGSLRARLRTDTAAAHEALDAALASLSLTTRDTYRTFLRVHRDGLAALAPMLGAAERGDLATLVAALTADLVDLGDGADGTVGAPSDTTAPRSFGAAYVLRGSRLGATMLARGIGDGLPCRYLTAPMAERWPDFLVRLERDGARASAQVIAGARDGFAAFHGAIAGDAGFEAAA